MAESYVTYTGDGSDVTYDITFPFLESTDIEVYVDGTLDTDWSVEGTVLTMDTAPGNGLDVLIKRVTPVADQYVEFSDSSALLADDLNNAFLQCLYKLEEVEERIDGLNLTGTGGTTTTSLPEPSAANVFAVSQVDGAGYSWTTKTVAQVQTLLGNTPVPSPVNSRFIATTTSGSPAYELKTAAEMRTLLSIGSNQLPDIASRGGYFVRTNSGASAYELVSPNDVKSALGLGSAAYLNAGTSVGNLPTLISPASGSTAALPVLSGENLTNVLRSMEKVVLVRAASGDSPLGSTSWTTVSTGIALSMPTTGLPSWCTLPGSGTFTLSEGSYIIEIEQFCWGVSSGNKTWIKLRNTVGLNNNTETTATAALESLVRTVSSGDCQMISLKLPLEVSSGVATFDVQMKNINSAGSYSGTGNYWEKNGEGQLSGHTSLKVTIVKFA